jgi:hypothetical protein
MLLTLSVSKQIFEVVRYCASRFDLKLYMKEIMVFTGRHRASLVFAGRPLTSLVFAGRHLASLNFVLRSLVSLNLVCRLVGYGPRFICIYELEYVCYLR